MLYLRAKTLLLATAVSLLSSQVGHTKAPNLAANAASDAPIHFRCDTLRVKEKTYAAQCERNVVLHRDPPQGLIVCCDRLNAQANPRWEWQTMTCRGNVRAQYNNHLVWAERATLNPTSQDLYLEGQPRLLRDDGTRLRGQQVHIQLRERKVAVKHPEGMVRNPQAPAPTPHHAFKAPPSTSPSNNTTCPLPAFEAQKTP